MHFIPVRTIGSCSVCLCNFTRDLPVFGSTLQPGAKAPCGSRTSGANTAVGA